MSGSVGRPLLLLLQVLSVPSLPRDMSVRKLLPYSVSGRRHVDRGKVPVRVERHNNNKKITKEVFIKHKTLSIDYSKRTLAHTCAHTHAHACTLPHT